MEGEARFLLEGVAGTFCVKLEGKTTQAEVLEVLKLMLPEETENTETIYADLKIKELEGTEIARN